MDGSNERVMRRAFEEIMRRGNVDAIDELFARDFAGHDTAGGTFGREEFKEGVLAMLSAFSHRQVVIADQVANGDKVATRWTATGVHSGDFNGIPATGRDVSLTGISIDRIAGGKIVESWEVTDDAGLCDSSVCCHRRRASRDSNAATGRVEKFNRRRHPMERIETVIVGGGQAGLATSYQLNQHGRDHVVLEQAAQAGSAWRNGRWDSFTLVTPNWTLRLPGAEYDGPDRDGFMPRDDIVAYFERYADRFALPVRYNARVLSVEPMDGKGYRVVTPERIFTAENVVIATGFEQLPKIPSFSAAISANVTQLHSSQYRNPESLPEGGVLVVGSAQSGAQIAEELYVGGRNVFLSVGGAGRAPRRYRGKDVVAWLSQIGFFDMTPDKLPVPKEKFAPPHVSGTHGGHTLNLHQFARDGVTLLGRVRGATDSMLSFAPDLHESLTRADQFELEVQKMIDGYIQANGLDAPEEELPQLRDGFAQPIIGELDLKAAGIKTIIWATGYAHDYGLVKMPVLDETGFPVQTRGVTGHAGLYFVGMPWMPSLKTGILAGVGEFAEHIASTIIAAGARGRRGARATQTAA